MHIYQCTILSFQVPTTTMCDTISSMATATRNEWRRKRNKSAYPMKNGGEHEETWKGTGLWNGTNERNNRTNVMRRNSVIKWSIFIAWLNMDLAWCHFANGCVQRRARERAKKWNTYTHTSRWKGMRNSGEFGSALQRTGIEDTHTLG